VRYLPLSVSAAAAAAAAADYQQYPHLPATINKKKRHLVRPFPNASQ